MRQGVPSPSTRYRPLSWTFTGNAVRTPAAIRGAADQVGRGVPGPPSVPATAPVEGLASLPLPGEPLHPEPAAQQAMSAHPSRLQPTGGRWDTSASEPGVG